MLLYPQLHFRTLVSEIFVVEKKGLCTISYKHQPAATVITLWFIPHNYADYTDSLAPYLILCPTNYQLGIYTWNTVFFHAAVLTISINYFKNIYLVVPHFIQTQQDVMVNGSYCSGIAPSHIYTILYLHGDAGTSSGHACAH